MPARLPVQSMNHRPLVLLAALPLLVAACTGNKTPVPTATAWLTPTQVASNQSLTPPPEITAAPRPSVTATKTQPTTTTAVQSTPTSAPTPQPTPRPDGLEFHFGPGVSSFDRSLITRAVEVTSDLLAEGASLSPPSAVFADISPRGLADLFSDGALEQPWRVQGMEQRMVGAVAEASYRGIVINTGSVSWRDMDASQRLRAVAHEYVHVIQLEQMGLDVADDTLSGRVDAVPPAGPFWLLEGSAEVVSWLVLQELDLGSYPESLFDYAADASGTALTLAELESFVGYRDGDREGLGLAVLAVDYLLRSRSLDALFDFWRDIGRGSDWTTAFTRQFGLPPPFLYVAFDSYYDSLWANYQP
jgi:hypothetical protein